MDAREKELCLLLLVLLTLLEGLTSAYNPGDIPYDDCGGKDQDQIVSIRVTGCDDDNIVCTIKMGDTLTIGVKWETFQQQITKLKSRLYVQFFIGWKMEVQIVPLDACKYLQCPLRKGSKVDYKANFTVPGENEIFPGRGRIWWYGFEDNQDDPLLCVNFQIIIEE